MQQFITRGATTEVRVAAAVLLAALASRNPETHAPIVMQSGTPALLMRTIHELPATAPLELHNALFACLSVCAGDTLPQGTVTAPVLLHHLGSSNLLNLLAFAAQVRVSVVWALFL
jgi:hypothetical protein